MSAPYADSAPSPQPGVIPYVEAYSGARRLLTVDTSGLTLAMVGRAPTPSVAIDGREYLVFQGHVVFEVPAERNVHIGIWANFGEHYRYWMASCLLAPADRPFLVWRKAGPLGAGALTLGG